jgi:hypothetical protein
MASFYRAARGRHNHRYFQYSIFVYASMLASSGQVDLYTLQKLLTHKSPIMTQRYALLRDQALRQAADLAGKINEQFIIGVSHRKKATATNPAFLNDSSNRMLHLGNLWLVLPREPKPHDSSLCFSFPGMERKSS